MPIQRSISDYNIITDASSDSLLQDDALGRRPILGRLVCTA